MRTLLLVSLCVALLSAAAPAVADVEEARTASGSASRTLARWTPLAERGERDAQFRLGAIYEHGDGVEPDFAEAHKWYVLAWKRHHAEAKTRALALRTKMTKAQFQDSRKRVRTWIDAFQPNAPDGVAGPERGGIELVQTETSRRRGRGFTVVCYKLRVTGAGANQKFRIWLWDLGMSVDGLAETALAPVPMEPGKMVLCFDRFRKGEWSRIKVTSPDGTILADTTLMPFPLQARQGRAHVWLQLMDSKGHTFAAFGKGFDPHEEVTSISRSNGEVIRSKLKADAQGKLSVLLMPAAVKRQHKASWSVVRKSGTLTVHYEWGQPALRIQ